MSEHGEVDGTAETCSQYVWSNSTIEGPQLVITIEVSEGDGDIF